MGIRNDRKNEGRGSEGLRRLQAVDSACQSVDRLRGYERTGIKLERLLHVFQTKFVLLQAFIGKTTANVRLSAGLDVDCMCSILNDFIEVMKLCIASCPVRVIGSLLLFSGGQSDSSAIMKYK